MTAKGAFGLDSVGASTWEAGEASLVPGTDGPDYLNGGSGDDWLYGGTTDDVLIDPFGNDRLHSNGGNDTLTALSGENVLLGGSGQDLMRGGIGSDLLTGYGGTDVLIGDISDFLFGNDTLVGAIGDDFLQGGRGSDLFFFEPDAGSDVIAVLAVNEADLTLTAAVAADFQPGIDHAEFNDFGYSSSEEILSRISDVGGRATFSDRGTTVTFFGVTTAELGPDDFFPREGAMRSTSTFPALTALAALAACGGDGGGGAYSYVALLDPTSGASSQISTMTVDPADGSSAAPSDFQLPWRPRATMSPSFVCEKSAPVPSNWANAVNL